MKMIKAILKELFIVTLGVFIALFVNDFIQKNRNETFVKNSLELIQLEQTENLNHLANVKAAQEKFIQNFKKEIENKNISVGEIIIKNDGLKIPLVSKTGWEKLLSNHLELIDYDFIKILTRIEMKIDFMEDIKSRLGEIGYANANKTDAPSKSVVLSLIQDLKRSVEALMEEYKKFQALTNAQ